jgi:hypothetical protein
VDEPAIEEKIKEIVIEDAIDSSMVVERVGINEPITKKKKTKSTKKKPVKRGKSTALLANIILQKPLSDSEEHSEDVVVDDLDDLLDTMSPLSSSSPFVDGNGQEEEFFTVDDDDDDDDDDLLSLSYPESRTSSVHIDSGDDEDIEDEETNAIIHEFDDDSDDSDDEEEDEEEQDEEQEEDEEEEEDSVSDMEDVDLFVEDEDEDEDEEDIHKYYYHQQQTLNSRWSSSDEEEEEEEFDYTSHLEYPTDDDDGMYESDDEQTSSVNPLLPLLDSDGNLYNNFASAFLQATDPIATDGTNTPSMDENPLSIFDLANALNILSAAETTNNDTELLLRRPSLPSSAVSAAHGPSQEFTSEALGAVLSALEDTESEYEDKHILTAPSSPTDFNIQQQIIDMLKSATEQQKEPILPQSPQKKTASRQILPKPVASGSSTASSSHHPLLEQQIQEALAESIEAARKRNFSDVSFFFFGYK